MKLELERNKNSRFYLSNLINGSHIKMLIVVILIKYKDKWGN